MKKSSIDLIREERVRQIEVEGWTLQHDKEKHNQGELVKAAICYATEPTKRKIQRNFERADHLIGWPWAMGWWKPEPNNRIRELVKAAALIAAEIDRLQNL